jgi:hypothetical protein
MSFLDCQTLDSTIASLAQLLSFDNGELELRSALSNLSLPEFEASLRYAKHDPGRLLWDRIVGPTTPPPIPATTYWFHATRVLPGTDFRDGIQPFGARIPVMKEFLETLAARIHLSPPREQDPMGPWEEQGRSHHSWKFSNRSDSGPFGFLVRDAIVRRDRLTHDYLAAPELVEDLAGSLAGDNAPLLIDEFRRNTKPCIVKFRSTMPRPDVVEAALFYCYRTSWGQEQCIKMNTNFDGEGQAIPHADIVSIKYCD